MYELFNAIRKWSLLIIFACAFFLFFKYHLYNYLNFTTLKVHQASLQEWTTNHAQMMITLYTILFTLMIACAIPCATFFTLLGGFLFGTFAFIYAMIAITGGGSLLYFAVRAAIGNNIKARTAGFIKRMEAGFQENAFNYLLTLRLVPIFPCWFSNVSAGALNIPFKTFFWATLIGIAPSTFIYVMVGRGLDNLFSSGETPNLNLMLHPSILLPLLALAGLSLMPVLIKWVKKRRSKKA